MSKSFSLTPSERSLTRAILAKHSRTYFLSTLFFPRPIRDQVFVLYAWVRHADELVDHPLENPTRAIRAYRKAFLATWEKGSHVDVVITLFVRMAKTVGIEKAWCLSFLDSMEMDLYPIHFTTYDQLERYIYGSADVIGLMMAKIMHVPTQALPHAAALGTWMQLVNMIRDVDEDISLGRIYLPSLIPSISIGKPVRDTAKIRKAIQTEITHAHYIYEQVQPSIALIPIESRFAVRLSIALYQWSLATIEHDPTIIWRKKVKPSLIRVLLIYLQVRFTP